LFVLGAIFYLLGLFPKVDAGKLALLVRKWGIVLSAAAAALIVTRNIGLGMLGGMLAYTAIQRTGWLPWGGARPRGTANVSTVRTAYLEMSLDHATSVMSGRVLQGRFAGRALSTLTAAERADCFAELQANDRQGAQLFEAYFDRIEPDWNAKADAGSRGSAGSRGMGIEEAYLVLGLNPGATRGDVHAAHRNLMKRYHPDQGGSNYLAAKVNEAKDLLIKHIPA
jgi:hypothetical protein